MDGTEVFFQPLVRCLPAQLDVRIIPYPPGGPYGYEDMVSLVMASLPAERPFLLLGWSFSGPVALKVAAQAPAGLGGVILCASFIRNPMRHLPRWIFPLARAILYRLVPMAVQERVVLGDHASPELCEMLRGVHRRVPAAALAARSRAVLRVDATAELRSCPVPLCYLASSDDRVVPPHNLERILRVRPSVRVETITGPHVALATNPEAAWRAIEGFGSDVGVF
jgi:pimeloyl-ACP methyl ester carboxylesterase